jgi:flagellar hook-associated protein 3 FlgL
MTGRVTQSMMSSQLIRNLNRNSQKMNDQQNQLATGRRINRPSDDPVGITYSMRYRSELSVNDQYISNADAARSWLDYSDTMMSQTGDVLQRTRELVTQAASGSNPQSALDSISKEVSQLYDQLVSIGNSKFNGKYVFNGEKTDVKPYNPLTQVDPVTGDPVFAAVQDNTDNHSIQFEIGASVTMGVNLTGQQIFGASTDSDNAFKIFQDITKALKNGDNAALSNSIGVLSARTDKVQELRSDIGAKTNRLDLAQGRLSDINTNLSNLQSKTEDADMAALMMNIKMSENVYQASLSAGSKVIQPSLVDFLK